MAAFDIGTLIRQVQQDSAAIRQIAQTVNEHDEAIKEIASSINALAEQFRLLARATHDALDASNLTTGSDVVQGDVVNSAVFYEGEDGA